MRRLLCTTVVLPITLATVAAQGTEIGFAERFALAVDREAELGRLTPGTADYYYYHSLHYQHTRAFAKVDALLTPWIESHGRTERVREIEHRQALLTFDSDPQATLAHLRSHLDLQFDDERSVADARRKLPSRLDPSLVDPVTLSKNALASHPGTLDGFTGRALSSLAATDLGDDLLMSLMQRLRHPAVPRLASLVVRNLGHRRSKGFGSLKIHKNLLIDQLEECIRLRPELIDDPRFIEVYLPRIRPNIEEDWQRDSAARLRYLQRLHAFGQRLAPTHNSFKAHVLYHWLQHDLATGQPNRDRFFEYLRLPRNGSYSPREGTRRAPRGREVDPSRKFSTGMPEIGDDEPLVRKHLEHFFARGEALEPFADYVRSDYLKRLLAETKILHGAPDRERWFAMLGDASRVEALEDRVELEFAPTQPRWFGPDDDVAVELDVKNVDKLLVKVFEINTFNYYRERKQEVDTSINLDGLVANAEQTHSYSESPFRRVRRKFEFPELNRPGVYVIDFIGNGIESRALIHKGRLRTIERPGAAGHVFRVLSNDGAHLKAATIWFGGREYTPDAAGEILIPYSTRPGKRDLILRHGDFAVLEQFQHRKETYHLRASFHLDHESMLERRTAKLLVRPQLLLADREVGIELLESADLVIRASDLDGTDSSLEFTDLELRADRELVTEIRVPPRLAGIKVSLRGTVRSLSTGERKLLVTEPTEFELNGIDWSERTDCPLLSRTEAGFVLEVRGKSGEPKIDRPVRLELIHPDYNDHVRVTLKTDASGRIHLGPLPGFVAVKALEFPNTIGAWRLRKHARDYPNRIHASAGEVIRVPYRGTRDSIRTNVSLIETRNDEYLRDARHRASLVNGYLELRDLTPGDYLLAIDDSAWVAIAVASGKRNGQHIVGPRRVLESSPLAPMHVTDLAIEGEQLRIQLANAGANTRVHAIATRYIPSFDPFLDMSRIPDAPPSYAVTNQIESIYRAGREIGDEYRYILERRFAKKFPGNMLRRPSLLLNRWALDSWNTALGFGGGAGGRRGGRTKYASAMERGGPGGKWNEFGVSPGTVANFEFLPRPSSWIVNRPVTANGEVRIDLEDLGDGHHIHVLAVDQDSTVYDSTTRPERPLAPRSRALAQSLDRAKHLTEHRSIDFLQAGDSVTLEDSVQTNAGVYDSLRSVYRLFRSLHSDDELATFDFLLDWPRLDDAEKRSIYSEYACHELHLFLHRKDPQFFADVVRPYLANKMHKTFLDEWLLERNLEDYLAPHRFDELNALERALLARRLTKHREAIVRSMRDHIAHHDPGGRHPDGLFAAAVNVNALDSRARTVMQLRDRAVPRTGGEGFDDKHEDDEVEEESGEVLEAPAEKPRASRRQRKSARRLYRAPEKTERYAERNYWQVRARDREADLIPPNRFWLDFASNPVDRPFASPHLTEAADHMTLASTLCALAVLDLPFEPGKHVSERNGGRVTLRAASPLLLARRELKAASPTSTPSSILVSQNFYEFDNRYRYEGGQKVDRYVSEFLVNVVYGCQVVVTNPGSATVELDLLAQIPTGAVPVNRGFYTRSSRIELDPYASKSLDFTFYFPSTGPAQHYPAQVARNAEFVTAAAPTATFAVVDKPTEIDKKSWKYLSEQAKDDELLRALGEINLHHVELASMLWRMRDRAFFRSALDVLRSRFFFDPEVWKYAAFHGDAKGLGEYLAQSDFAEECGSHLASNLLELDAIQRRSLEHLEFDPLINARAHRFGQRRRILNDGVAKQYAAFLDRLCHRARIDDADWMGATYYLLLQDRIDEAITCFGRVRPDGFDGSLQYDYMRAYLDFFSDTPRIARGIAERHRNHPVERWRARFREILSHLDEADGKPAASALGDGQPDQASLAATDPSIDLRVEARNIKIDHRNVTACEVNFYEMDVESLFTTHPFVSDSSGSFAFIRPNRTSRHDVSATDGVLELDLPDAHRNSNVLVEVRAGGVVRRQPYFANSLSVRFAENYGQLAVANNETGKPMPKVYVKVFARGAGNRVRFYKDGYTDLRGRFDYASVSGDRSNGTNRFAILVLSERDGAMIREIAPPTE